VTQGELEALSERLAGNRGTAPGELGIDASTPELELEPVGTPPSARHAQLDKAAGESDVVDQVQGRAAIRRRLGLGSGMAGTDDTLDQLSAEIVPPTQEAQGLVVCRHHVAAPTHRSDLPESDHRTPRSAQHASPSQPTRQICSIP
jgi:hypothetical protein